MTSGARILVIDDEPQIHRFLRPALEVAGYQVERADAATAGLRQIANRAPDLVLLDLGLPDMDGQDALARLRSFSDVPVIVLSARDRETDKIAALDGGADDYIEKPFGIGELLARIRTALRHKATSAAVPEVILISDLELRTARHQARVKGELVALSRKEWDLLLLLARNAGRVVTHRQLLTGIWGPAHAHDVQYLRVYVGQLRQKLGSAARLIETEPGVGYRMAE